MKIIYFCYEYYCNHGGRTHARSFFEALSTHPLVSETIVFPSGEKNGANAVRGESQYPSILTISIRIARLVWRNAFPEWLRKQINLFFPSPEIYRSLSSVIRKEHPDAIVLRIGGMFRFIQRLRRDFPDLKICIEFNATGFDESKTWIPWRNRWRREEARQFGFADSVCVVSGYLQRYLVSLNLTLAERITVNPNGVDVELFKPLGEEVRLESRREMGIPDNAVAFGYVGGMESFRRLPEVVRQVAALRRGGMDRLFLVIVGTGTEKEAVSDALSECDKDLGGWVYSSNQWVEHNCVPYLMAAFDAGFIPYTSPYCSPLKITEYMSFGLPVVCPDIPGVTETFDREYLPFLVRQDGGNFEEVVRHVYENIKDCKATALRSRGMIQREFTWDANAAIVVDEIIGNTS
jgi:glycosyltransferase involved in cell wall biosynthesis